jgi:hypothetical protein
MSIDRRQFKRFETLLIVEVGAQEEGSPYFFGITKNVSFEGFIFESQNYDLRAGDVLEFCLKHPKNSLSVTVLGEIVWNSETKFECHSGVRFHRFDTETKSKVFELISADSIEHSGHMIMGDEVRSAAKRNGKAEPEKKGRDDMLSGIIGEAATQNKSNRTGQDDIRNGVFLPADGRKHTDDNRDETAQREVTGNAGKIPDQQPAAQKKEGKSGQGNVSKAAAGSTTVRRKGHKKRTPYALVAIVFFALLTVAALIIFLSDDIREKMMTLLLGSTFIENSDAVIRDGRIPALNVTDAPEPPLLRIDQSGALPDYDKKSADGHGVTGTAMPPGQNGQGDLASHDYNGTAERLTAVPMPAVIAAEQDAEVLLREPEREEDQSVASQDHSDRMKDKSSPGNITIKDSGDKNISATETAASEKKKEALQKIRAAVQEESKADIQAVKENRAEKPAEAVDKTGMRQTPVQERTEAFVKEENDKSIEISEPEKDEADNKKQSAVQNPDETPRGASTNGGTVSSQDNAIGRDVPTAENLTGSIDGQSVRVSEPMKKSMAGEMNAQGVLKASAPVRQTPAETLLATKDAAQPETDESELMNEKPERTEPLTMQEPEKQDVENISTQGQLQTPQDMDAMPKIALVVQRNRSSVSDVKNKPEITDEYLKKYFTAYTDSFNDNSNNWDIFDIGAATARIEDGLYHIENKKERGALIVLHYQRFPHESDFVLEIAVRGGRGQDRNAYGFIFGAKDARNNYSFQIAGNKYYSVKNYQDGVAGQLTAGEIKDPLTDNSPALLKIVKQADEIHFYINNWHADKVSNIKFYGDRIGFIVEGKSHIAVDYTRSYIRNRDK